MENILKMHYHCKYAQVMQTDLIIVFPKDYGIDDMSVVKMIPQTQHITETVRMVCCISFQCVVIATNG